MGWIEPTPSPTIQDLFPQHVLQKCLDLWLATGTNVAYSTLSVMLGDAEEDPQFFQQVVESMECEVMDRLHSLSIKWQLEEDALMAARTSADGEEGEAK